MGKQISALRGGVDLVVATPGRLVDLIERRSATLDSVEVTVLDVPVLGRDREDVARRVERLRGRTPAATFAQRHAAGTAAEQARRYRGLADLGVGTVFVALPDLVDADDLRRLEPVLDRLR